MLTSTFPDEAKDVSMRFRSVDEEVFPRFVELSYKFMDKAGSVIDMLISNLFVKGYKGEVLLSELWTVKRTCHFTSYMVLLEAVANVYKEQALEVAAYLLPEVEQVKDMYERLLELKAKVENEDRYLEI